MHTRSLPDASPRSDRPRCGGREIKFLAAVLVAVFGISSAAFAGTENKLDADLASARGSVPVFVRFDDQVFRKGGDFEDFCRKNKGGDRLALRTTVLGSLKEKSARSWKAVEPLVRRLENEDQVRAVERYWIINGFACLATAEGSKALGASDEVAFVYLQRVPNLALHAREPAKAPAADSPLRKRYEALMDAWEDDSATPLDLKATWMMCSVTISRRATASRSGRAPAFPMAASAPESLQGGR
jgi:hypothetical protein